MLVAIINHNYTADALALRRALLPTGPTVALDSGSVLTPAERKEFDLALPNVYYSGLINAIAGLLRTAPEHEAVLIWASDVSHPEPAAVAARWRAVMADPRIGLYAPSVQASSHRHMRACGAHGLRSETFVEGFCFAVRRELLAALCPVDTKVNALGWGLDVHLGYLARNARQRVVVDHDIRVHHVVATGYDKRLARNQRDAWYRTLPPAAQRFRRHLGLPFGHTLARLAPPW